MSTTHLALAALLAAIAACSVVTPAIASAGPELRDEVSQYGITWKLDKPYPAGQFANGDWWVVGPVRVVSVTPEPGPARDEGPTDVRKNQFGDAGLQDDRRMRNGSMIVLRAAGKQGYDSRVKNYDPAMSAAFPLVLDVNRSLISTVSNADVNVPNFAAAIMWEREKRSQLALKTAAVLTCLPEPPPADAFRPPYVGVDKPIYRVANLKRDKLLKLKPVGEVPSFEQFARYFQRPWLDHASSWLIQVTGPSENMPSYGRENSRIISIASLMLQLDVPDERKEPLLIGLVQLGIDLHGLARNGREWTADGGHWSGRKWPILFAGLMLDDAEMLERAATHTFSEDQQTYYGRGWAGQPVLFQMVSHHGPRRPYEEHHPDEWDAMDKRSESYRMCCTAKAWIGTALAAQLMRARRHWNHDAYFDYCDRWMAPDDAYAAARGGRERPKDEGKVFDPFVAEMWHAYRGQVPDQPRGERHRKWVWTDGGGGQWVENREAE
jgi:hypothetical protein